MRSLDELADLAPDGLGHWLVTADESQWFDRKSIRIQAKDLAPALTGLANAEGGLLAIGVHDGVLEGVESEPGRVNAIRQAAIDFTVPPVPMAAREFACARPDGSLAKVLLLEVRASDRVHATMRDEVYLRVGDETRLLGFDQRRELDFDKGQSTFETEPLRIMGPDAIDEGLLTATADALGLTDPMRVLPALGLRDRDGIPSVGAALLFSQNPQAELPSAFVRVIRYKGTDRGTGTRQQMVLDESVGGPLTTQITSARRLVREHLPRRRALGPEGTFTDVRAVPEDAWLEGLVNAVTHRSYSHVGDHTRIEIFDDRVEISSPGRFPGVVDPTDPTSIARFARNPRIARVLKAHDFGQELGEGIRRMFEEMELAGLEDPAYRQTAGAVQLTLSARSVDLELERRLPDGARELVRAIRDRGRASTGELVKSLGRSRPTLLRELNLLRDEGVVRWVGTSPKDPRAYWTLP